MYFVFFFLCFFFSLGDVGFGLWGGGRGLAPWLFFGGVWNEDFNLFFSLKFFLNLSFSKKANQVEFFHKKYFGRVGAEGVDPTFGLLAKLYVTSAHNFRVEGTGLGGPFCNKRTFGSFEYKQNDNQSLIGIPEFWGLKEGGVHGFGGWREAVPKGMSLSAKGPPLLG